MTTVNVPSPTSAGVDTYLREDQATTNYGTGATVNLCSLASYRSPGLFSFDVSGIPAGSKINSATLHIWNSSTATGDRAFAFNSILVANSGWTEAGAKWNTRSGSDYWAGDTGNNGGTDAGCSVSGTDWNASALGTLTYTANTAANTEHTVTFSAAQVEAWLTANYGCVMRITSTNQSFNWHSSDASTAGYRPYLAIDYTAPEVVAGNSIFRAPCRGRW